MIFRIVKDNLNELMFIINQLTQIEYTQKNSILNKATIGEHTRHIIELFQTLLFQYETGIVNYSKRNRDKEIEDDKNMALYYIKIIQNEIERKDKRLKLIEEIEKNEILFETSYLRELYYNYEHAIHHQAIIKIAVNHITQIEIPKNFGVAYSTIKHKEKMSNLSCKK